MISRRTFLAALSAIPVFGKYLNHGAALAAGDDVGRSVHAPREVCGYPFAPVDMIRGDIFVIEGVNGINPITFEATRLQRFAVTEDVLAGESLADVMTPQPLGPGCFYQNVTCEPRLNARVKALRSWDDVFALKDGFA